MSSLYTVPFTTKHCQNEFLTTQIGDSNNYVHNRNSLPYQCLHNRGWGPTVIYMRSQRLETDKNNTLSIVTPSIAKINTIKGTTKSHFRDTKKLYIHVTENPRSMQNQYYQRWEIETEFSIRQFQVLYSNYNMKSITNLVYRSHTLPSIYPFRQWSSLYYYISRIWQSSYIDVIL